MTERRHHRPERRPPHMRNLCRGALLMTCAGTVPLNAAAAPDPLPHVAMEDPHHLTVHAQQVPTSILLTEIHRVTGVPIHVQLADDKPLTIHLDAVPVTQALRAILRHSSHVATHAESDAALLRKVWVLDGPDPYPPASGSPGEEPEPTLRAERALPPRLDAGALVQSAEAALRAHAAIVEQLMQGDAAMKRIRERAADTAMYAPAHLASPSGPPIPRSAGAKPRTPAGARGP